MQPRAVRQPSGLGCWHARETEAEESGEDGQALHLERPTSIEDDGTTALA
jgi:hypothetical protein